MNAIKTLKLGPLWFAPGVTKINLGTMLFTGFGTMAIVSFMSFMQPYVLTELLNVPQDQQGALTGNLHAFQEIIFIAIAGFVGAISDKLGRPLVYGAGFIVVSAGYAIYPLTSEIYQLYIVRALFAVGVATVAVMLSACTVDYIQERSRGRWVGMMSVFNGLGIVTMSAVLSQLPAMYEEAGNDVLTAGRLSFWTVSAFCLVVGLVLVFGLYRGTSGGKDDEHSDLLAKVLEGAKAGVRSPRLAIAYGGAFIGRGDFAVIGTFFSLWLTQVGIENGKSTAEALAIAGPVFGLIQVCALVWAPFMGIMTDRLRRTTAVSLGLLIAGSGYMLMSQVTDPVTSGETILTQLKYLFTDAGDFSFVTLVSAELFQAGVLLGMGETSVIVSVASLLGQESDSPHRGAIVGVFGLLGGFGILATTFIGGQLFDGVGRTAPFAMMGIFNFILMAAALYVRSAHAHTEPDTKSSSSDNKPSENNS